MSCQALRGQSSTVRRAPRWGPLWGTLGGTPKTPQGPQWWAVDGQGCAFLVDNSQLLLPAVPYPMGGTRTWKARHFQGQPLTGGIFIALLWSPFGMRARGCLMPNTTQRGPGCRRGPDRKLGAARHGLARGIADDKWAHTRLHERDGLEILGSSTGCAGANCLGRGATHGMQNTITMPGTLRDRPTYLRHTHAPVRVVATREAEVPVAWFPRPMVLRDSQPAGCRGLRSLDEWLRDTEKDGPCCASVLKPVIPWTPVGSSNLNLENSETPAPCPWDASLTGHEQVFPCTNVART